MPSRSTNPVMKMPNFHTRWRISWACILDSFHQVIGIFSPG
jgi:hypothetical protein